MADTYTKKWQLITLATLFSGYSGYYICRSNLSVVTPLMLGEFSDYGLTKEHIGTVASVGVLLYAMGKITNGLASDFLGGRTLFLLGMVVSVLCTVAFGMAGGFAAFVAIWAVNRYFQSMGWVSLVKVSSRWYSVKVQATVLGILSMSFLLGDALARLFLGSFIHAGVGWRGVFLIAAATLSVITVVNFLFLHSSPKDVGCEEPPAPPGNVFGQRGNEAKPDGLMDLLVPLLTSVPFWTICILNVGLTLIRETFNFWTPTFLHETVGLEAGMAAMGSLAFPLIGAASAVIAGVLADRLGGRLAYIIVPSLVMLIVAILLLAVMPLHGRPVLALSIISMVSFFLLAPYSFLGGVMAVDFGGKRGSSTASGIIDSAGYFGAVMSGWAIGSIAQRYSWEAVFGVLVVAAMVSLAIAVAYLFQERKVRKKAAEDLLDTKIVCTQSPAVTQSFFSMGR